MRDENMDVPEIIRKLDEVKDKLSKGEYIKVLKFEEGSLILHVSIRCVYFKSRRILHEAIFHFLHELFILTESDGQIKSPVNVVLSDSDCYYSDGKYK